MSHERRALTDYVAWAIIVGAGLVILGLLLIWLSTQFRTEVAAAFWSNVGTAILTTGLLGIAYDAFLRRKLTDDVILSSTLSRNLLHTGITAATVDGGVAEYRTLLHGARVIRVLPLDPLRWASQNMPALLDLARTEPIDVTVYLPAAKLYSSILSEAAPPSVASAEPSCAEVARDIVHQWRLDTRTVRSSLRIMQYDGYPHTGVLVAENVVVISSATPHGPRYATQGATFVFEGVRARAFHDWAEWALESLPNAVAIELVEPSLVARSARDILPLTEEMPTAAGPPRLRAQEDVVESPGGPT